MRHLPVVVRFAPVAILGIALGTLVAALSLLPAPQIVRGLFLSFLPVIAVGVAIGAGELLGRLAGAVGGRWA